MRADRNLAAAVNQSHASTRRRVTGLTAAVAAPAVRQFAGSPFVTSPVAVALPGSVAAGDLVVVGWLVGVGGTCTVTDSQTNTYSTPVSMTNGSVAVAMGQSWAKASASGLLTVTLTSSTGQGGGSVYDVSGVASATPVDQSASQPNGSGTGATMAAFSGLASANDFIAHWSVISPPGNAVTGGIWADDFTATIAGSPYMDFMWAVTGPNASAPVRQAGTAVNFQYASVAYHP